MEKETIYWFFAIYIARFKNIREIKLDRSGFLGLREKIINFGKDMHYNHIMKIEYNLNF